MPSTTSPPRTGAREAVPLLVLLLGAATIGFAPILVRLTETGPAAGGLWRLVFAAPALLAMHLAVRRDNGGGGSRGLQLGLLAGLLFAGDLACWHYGVAMTSVANATVLANLSPIVVAVTAWWLHAERPRPLFAAGVLIGVAGACGMALFGDHVARPSSLEGDALSAATAFWYGLYMLAVNAARRFVTAATVMFWSTIAGIPVLLAVALAMGESIMPASASGWLACAGLGAVHVVGQGAIAWALGRLRATLASVVILVQPVVAAIAGVWLFDERLAALQIASGLLALTGIVIARSAANPKAAPVAAPA
ncbi:MAG: DMT family transporter [Alphaproteobacteria bacterium]|nr:DMT family transporter [Alphaproteobacteria bacterium]